VFSDHTTKKEVVNSLLLIAKQASQIIYLSPFCKLSLVTNLLLDNNHKIDEFLEEYGASKQRKYEPE
jgi:hypothetical protein